MKNIIIGKNSSISKYVQKNLKNSYLFSANKLNERYLLYKIKKYGKINLIFNNFYPSKKLNKLNHNDYKKFCELSLEKISLIFQTIPSYKINKIIYTSSASVYRISENLSHPKKDNFNRELYSSFKLAAEKLIINYANKKKKEYFIMRLFNTYGDFSDEFSFIENIINSKKNNKKIYLINNGNSIRDFIHVKDIGIIYKKFIENKLKKGIYDIGTGNGYLIKDIIDFSNFKKSKIIKKNNIDEIHNSVAQNQNLIKELKNFRFLNLGKYLKQKLKINKKIVRPILNQENETRKSIIGGVVIYGAGYAGKQIYHELNKNNENTLFFIDDDFKIQNTNYQGIPIISFRNLLEIRKNFQIKRIYLTIPSLNKRSLEKMIKKIKTNFFDVRYLPEKKFLISDKINIEDLNLNEINSILNRKQIKLKKIQKLSNKTILVTGAAGTIGSEICRQLIQHNVKKVIAIDKSEIGIYDHQKKTHSNKISFQLIDVNDYSFLEKTIKENNVQMIFHAAAYKHVNILENNVYSAVKNNVLATYNICELAIKNSCEMIFISTDKAANPTSILGYTKRSAEKICELFNQKHQNKKQIKIVRFGNVFGSSGSAINNFLDKINSEDPIEITSKKASRYFMTVLEACHLVLQTTTMNLKGNTFILNMGKPVNILQLAKNLAKIKTKINNNYNFEYREVGLQPGEKLNETLKDKKEILKKISNEIFMVNNKNKNISKFQIYFEKLKVNFLKGDNNKIVKNLKDIAKFC
jgi:FlaA1/EpsC-like NDP-sugar epimerase